MRRLSRLHWFLGSHAEAERYGLAAVELLETLPPDRKLAMAYANMANLRMVESDTADALIWGERAIALAERLGDTRPSATPSIAWEQPSWKTTTTVAGRS